MILFVELQLYEVDYVWLSIKTQLSKLSAVSIYEKNHTLMNISSDCFNKKPKPT